MRNLPSWNHFFTDPGYYPSQLNAATICVPAHSLASLFLITVHVHIPMLKKKLSLEKGALSVCPRADSKPEKRHERSNWPGRGFCDSSKRQCIISQPPRRLSIPWNTGVGSFIGRLDRDFFGQSVYRNGRTCKYKEIHLSLLLKR